MSEEFRRGATKSTAAILFDKDGTLFDFRRTWLPILFERAESVAGGDEALATQLVKAAGYNPDTDRFCADGPIAAGNATDLARAWQEVLSEARQRRGAPSGGSRPNERSVPTEGELIAEMDRKSHETGAVSSVPVTDLRELFSTLHEAGIALGVATSDTTRAARDVLERHEVLELVTYVAGYDGPAGKKPAPEVAKAFYEPLGLPASRVMIVGDTWHDLTMARSCGCVAVAVLTGAVEREDLVPYADIVLESIAELPVLLGLVE